jgi:hypothetical protein
MDIGVHSQEHVSTEEKAGRSPRKCLVKCPACGEKIPASVEAEIVLQARRKSAVTSGAGRKPSPQPCRKCGQPFGARELRVHEPGCEGVPGKPKKAIVTAVLGILAGGREYSGPDLVVATSYEPSVLYPALFWLEGEGQIYSRSEPKARRRLYRLSDPVQGRG